MTIRTRNIVYGVKGSTEISINKKKKKKYTAEPQRRIDICLSCTKPAKECKGKCFDGK